MRKIYLGLVGFFISLFSLTSCGGDSSNIIDAAKNLEDSSSSMEKSDRSSSSSAEASSSSKKQKNNSSEDEDSENSEDEENVEDDNAQKAIAACSSMDDGDVVLLNLSSDKTLKVVQQLLNHDLSAKAKVSSLKTNYQTLLDKYKAQGSVCPAITFGYGITFFADVLNDPSVEKLRAFYDYYNVIDWKNVASGSFFQSVLTTIQRTSSAMDSDFAFETQKMLLSTAIPALDSAIYYVKSSADLDDFSYNIDQGDYVIQLDQSEFALVLGMMYVTKGLFEAVSSVNLDLSNNGSYSWISYYNDHFSYGYTTEEMKAMSYVADLLGDKTGLTHVYAGYESIWESIPSVLKSGLKYVKKGLAHTLTDEDQIYDVFVVGDDVNADFSAGKIQQFIHALDGVESALVGNYSFEYASGKSVTLNIQKFFNQTSGFMKYMPKIQCGEEDCYFVDLDGNPTISLRNALDGKYVKGLEAEYFYFVDPTLGGVFPKFNQESIWNFILYFAN